MDYATIIIRADERNIIIGELTNECWANRWIRNEVAVFRAKMESILNSQLQLLDGCVLGESKIAVDTADMDDAEETAEAVAVTEAAMDEEPVVDADDTTAEESQKTQNV